MNMFRNIIRRILPYSARGFILTYSIQVSEVVRALIMWLPLQFIRVSWFRLFGGRAGHNVQICRNVRFKGYKSIRIGKDSHINCNAMLDGRNGIVIGDNVDVGEYVKIWSLEHDPNSNDHVTRGKCVRIGDHAWIAPWSIIMPGVKIGRGAVVAGGAVVTKDVPPLAIVGGVPAKVIGWRKNDLQYTIKHHQIL